MWLPCPWHSQPSTVLRIGLISWTFPPCWFSPPPRFLIGSGSTKAEILGYTLIVVSALLIFFGVRSYRENGSGGRLTFARGFAVGILITLILSICCVATCEITYFKFMADFADKYAACSIEKAKTSGASHEKIEKKSGGWNTSERFTRIPQ